MRRALVSIQEVSRSLRFPGAYILRNGTARPHHLDSFPIHKFQLPSSVALSRDIHVSCSHFKETVAEEVDGEDDPVTGNGRNSEPPRDPAKDRTVVIPVEVSMRYLESNAYKETYGDTPVWVLYRRNFKGQFAPKKTRRTCVRQGMITTGNPCPICRDEYLVLDYRNVKLLKQFISPFNGEVLHWDKTGLCRVKQMDLHVEMEKARDYGTITFDVPIRQYNYSDYYKTATSH